MIKYSALVTIFLSITISVVFSQNQIADNLKSHVEYLASDDLKGRKPGTEGDILAAEYIKEQFEQTGLELMYEDGMQHFEVISNISLGDNNSLGFSGNNFVCENDYIPYAFTENTSLTAEVVFAGYGFDITTDSITWNDYASFDVKNKWVMILRGAPVIDEFGTLFDSQSSARSKALTAKDNGASGILLVSSVEFDEEDELVSLFYDKSTARAGIPVLHIKRDVADQLLMNAEKTIESLANKINNTKQSFSVDIPVVVSASTEIIHEKKMTQNVVGLVKGSEYSNQYIVVGAHYDHLGMGGPGSGSRALDTIAVHNGADDNASGVAGVIELARGLTAIGGAKRSVVFIAFGAEEMGLLGSKYFVDHTFIPFEEIKAMVNFDMIGRFNYEEDALMIGGTGTSLETVGILDEMSKSLDFSLKYSSEGFGASDHSSFYLKDVPVFFVTSGAHDDYHTPYDDTDKLNFYGSAMIVDFTGDLLLELANREENLTFQEAGPKDRPQGRRGFKVTLGIMPDFASSENNGLGVDAVRPDGPAYKGGMKKGDRIVALNGQEVTNIYDYMHRLKELKAGEIITVDVIRNDEKVVLIVHL